ncbi:MAG: KamA family radical SAM protein [Planctomycetes bacterium]|nr:KamA family radical SAM protein [Planctomycetota bacterium]
MSESSDDKPPGSYVGKIARSGIPPHHSGSHRGPLEGTLPVLGSIGMTEVQPYLIAELADHPPITAPRRRRLSPAQTKAREFRRRFFPEAGETEWNDWRWQSRHRVRTLAQVERMLRLTESERLAMVEGGAMLPVGVTPYYMSLLDPIDANQPLRRTVIPTHNEFLRSEGEADDPLGEEGHSPVPGLVHRYPDRALLLALDFCSTYCRYCTRSRVVGHGEITPNESRLEAAFDYLRRRPQIRDVLISGGDPLSLGEDRLEWILKRLRQIPHIEFVRIGTKMPAVLPQRITPQLTRMLRRFHPLWMSLHFAHPDECTPEAERACGRLADAGIPLGSQTVLLKGVNDDVDVMKRLIHQLLRMRVRPYYLYQCDPISGSSHFRTTVEKGIEIIRGLRGHTTGYAVPMYVIDAPGGGGKIPLQPETILSRDGDDLLLRNFEGKVFRYPDPVDEKPGLQSPRAGIESPLAEPVGA